MYRIIQKALQMKVNLLPQIGSLKNLQQIYFLNRPLSSQKTQKSIYLIDDNDTTQAEISPNKFTKRTHTCGELTMQHIGQKVILWGWLEYQRMNKFIILRDSYGEIQLLISDNYKNIAYESIIQIRGTVIARPKEMVNKGLKTGEIEVDVEELFVANKAKDLLPFNIREFQKAKESLRMQYRYLDLRFPLMQRNLRFRSKLFIKMREFLVENHFVDVETPTLFKATPGGAQEFLVPTRFPGKFYSLVQSPQQFKQMLMAGGLDRYFQIAKCYRDEGARSDRQPEFTQLDIELSFTDVDGVINLIEELLHFALKEFFENIPKKFPRISYQQALESYGTDKPDTSFEYQIQNCTSILNETNLNRGNDLFGAYLLIFEPDNPLTKSVKDKMRLITGNYSSANLLQFVVNDAWKTKTEKLFSSEIAQQLLTDHKIEKNSIVFISYGNKAEARELLGRIRIEYVKLLEEDYQKQIKSRNFHFLWVVDFPLFELNSKSGNLQSAHHPFTAPHSEDINLLNKDPLKVKALAYDLVLNGSEIGGGSIRIHDPILQENILNLLNIERNTLQHIIDMLGSGCPPHGGIALGLDRILSILLNMPSIRDVIAFPKTFEGKDPISQAPSEVSKETLKLYHLNIKSE